MKIYSYFLKTESGDEYHIVKDKKYSNVIDFMKNEVSWEYECWSGYKDDEIPYNYYSCVEYEVNSPEKKTFKVEDIERFADDHIKLKNADELSQILGYKNNIEAFKHGLIEGIINGICSFCEEHYQVEGIE